MKITPREELLMRRALDPASSAAEAETAAQAFVRSLRKRGINGYDFVSKTGEAGPSPQPPPQQPKPEPPPQPDPKWDFMREQGAHAQREATEDPPPQTSWPGPQPNQSSGTGCLSRVMGLIVIAFIGMCYNTCHPGNTYTTSRNTKAWSTPGPVETPYRFRDSTPTPSPTPTPTATPVERAELVATPTPVKRAELVNDLPLPQIEAFVRNYLEATGDGRPISLKSWVADQLGRWYDTEYITREMAEAKVAGYYRRWPFQQTQLAGPYRWRKVSDDLYAIYQPIIWTGKGGSNQAVVVRTTFCALVEKIKGTWRISSAWNDASQ